MPRKKSKTKRLKTIFLNPLSICAYILLLCVGWIALSMHHGDVQHNQLVKDGADTIAFVQQIKFSAYQYRGGRSITTEQYADALTITVTYTVNEAPYTEVMGMTYSKRHNDHVAVYQEAKTGTLKVRYLRSNPTVVRPLAEFTDPKNNPASGGK